MNNLPKWITAFARGLLLVLLLAIGLKTISPKPAEHPAETLLIAAATSVQNALEKIDPLFEQANIGITVNYHFAASGSLQQQIEQGAPVDVFIAAATEPMDALQNRDRIVMGTRQNLLTNRLVLIVPTNARLGLTNFQQLTNAAVKKIALGEPRSVPAGKYAEELFSHLGILEQLRSKFVYGNSVRNVLGAVESGNADAGIVYITDAKSSSQVRPVILAPSNVHSPIVYPIAVIKTSRNQQAARTYIQFLSTQPAQAIFKQFGFEVVS